MTNTRDSGLHQRASDNFKSTKTYETRGKNCTTKGSNDTQKMNKRNPFINPLDYDIDYNMSPSDKSCLVNIFILFVLFYLTILYSEL
jgi:hypothetical protein